jgi:hypothetical protein
VSLFKLALILSVAFVVTSCGNKPAQPNANTAVAAASPGSSQPPEPAKKVFESGEAVPAGYLGYKIIGSSFKDQPSGTLLYVDMAIVNTDKKERPVTLMKLVDETGKEFSLSDKGGVASAIGKIGMVPASQSKRATAVFEAPRGHQYKLKIQGFSATDEVEIKLKFAAKPPSG